MSFGVGRMDWSPLSEIGENLQRAGLEQRKLELAKKMSLNAQSGDYAAMAQAALEAGETGTGLAALKLNIEATKDKRQQQNAALVSPLLNSMYGRGDTSGVDLGPSGGSGGSPAPAAPRPHLPSFSETGGPSGGYLSSLITRESGGNANAKAKTSSATGLAQFTTGTWAGVMRDHPELGLTVDGRTDPQQSIAAAKAHTEDNEKLLSQAGLPVNDATRYSMHFLGSGGGRRFVAGAMRNPDAPATSYANADQVAANRNVFYRRDGSAKTAGEVMGDFARSFGGGGSNAPAPVVGAPTQWASMNGAGMPTGNLPPGNVGLPQPPEARGPVPGATIPPSSSSGSASLGSQRGTVAASDMPAPSTAGFDGSLSRTMTMPGAPAAPGLPAPVQVAGGGMPAETPERIGPVPTQAISGIAPSKRLNLLGKLQALDLPEAQQGLIKELMRSTIDEMKVPDEVKTFLWAKRTGQTQARTFGEFKREMSTDGSNVTMAPGSSLVDRQTGRIVTTTPNRENTRVSDEIEARAASAGQYGLQPGSPAYQSFVLTGKMPREDAQPLTATDKRAILEADEGVMSAETAISNLQKAKEISKEAYAGPFAKDRGYYAGLAGMQSGLATTELDNIVTTNALSQLKSIFGAAPTEGERKILLDIQGSSNLPHAARVKIYDRAIAAAEKRLGFSRDRASELRGQTFYRPGGGTSRGNSGTDPRALPRPSPSNRPGAATAADRFGELSRQGLSKADVYRQLQSEGY